MSGGVKHDENKPDLSHISWELVSLVAQVRMFGAKKYTKFGECTCGAKIVNEIEKYGLRSFVKAATTLLTLKIDQAADLSTKENTVKRIENVSTSLNENIALEILGIRQKEDLKDLNELTTLETLNFLNCFHRLLVQFVVRETLYVSTTTTKQAELENVFAKVVISHLDSWKKKTGLEKHANTCQSLQVVLSGRNNWKKGFKVTRSCAAALRHIFLFLSGETNDSESGLSHIGHALCCLEHCAYDMQHHPENDDRSKK